MITLFVIGKACAAPGPVCLSCQVAEDVIFKGGNAPQCVGGGQFAVKAADFIGGDVVERVLFADRLVVVVEPSRCNRRRWR